MRKKILLILSSFLLCMTLVSFAGNHAFAEDEDGQATSNIVVQTIPGPSLADRMTSRTKISWAWYLARGSGAIAAVALVILMLSGIGQVTGYTFRFLEPLTAWASHRALGIAFGVSVLIHMFSLLFDHFVSFNIWQILVPWLSKYKPVTIWGVHLGSLYIALGVISFYAVILITITSLVWVEKKPYLWKIVHLLSYIVMLLVFVHALYLGTDLTDGLLRWAWIGTGAGIAFACIHRLWRAKTT